MTQTAGRTAWYVERFDEFVRSLNGSSSAQLLALRKEAMDAFAAKKKAEDEAREKERRAQAEATKAKLAQVLKQSEDSGKAASASAAERERRATAEKKEQADKIQEQYAHGLI